MLPNIGLECLKPTDLVRCRENVAASEVFQMLFSAACTGGAYDNAHSAAYGRLLTWLSLAGLVGLPADTPIPEIAASAESCCWYLFDSPNDWYDQVAWDVGIACASPARKELAVLAATDTD